MLRNEEIKAQFLISIGYPNTSLIMGVRNAPRFLEIF